MPVSADTVQFSYTGDGSTTVFPFPSRFLSNTDIIVGVAGAQVLTGFTVTGAGADAGGNVTFAVAPINGVTVTLIRAPAISQLLDFVNNQTVLAENIDNSLDKLTIIAQYLDYLIDRTIRLSQFDTALTGSYDLQGRRIGNAAAPVDANDLARLVDLQSVVSGEGNVPSPTIGQIGYRLQALAAGIFGWVAAGSTSSPDGTLSAPGVNFASELNTGLLRPSAGLLQTSVLGVLRMELSTTALRLLVSLLSTNGTVTGGTDAQGQGAMTNDQNTVTSTPNSPSGVTLPTAVAGRRVIVANRGTNPINVYPALGANIGALAVNLPISLAVGQSAEFFARTATQWEGQVDQVRNGNLTELSAPTFVRGDLARRGSAALERLTPQRFGQCVFFDGTDTVFGREEYFYRPRDSRPLANATGNQSVFGVGVTLEADASYEYDLVYSLSKTVGTTSHTISTGFGGTAAIGNPIRHPLLRLLAGTDTSYLSPGVTFAMGVSTVAITAATVRFNVSEQGQFHVTAAGTLIPQIAFSAAPGGAYGVIEGAYMRVKKFGGSGAFGPVVQGPWA